MADVPARRRGARQRVDRRDHAIHPERIEQRPAARRSVSLRPLALFRRAAARRLQVRRPDDYRAVGGTGTSDRTRSLRTAWRLPAGFPPFRDAAVAPARARLAHAVAQPDHGRRLRRPGYKISKTTPCKVERAWVRLPVPVMRRYTCQRQLYL